MNKNIKLTMSLVVVFLSGCGGMPANSKSELMRIVNERYELRGNYKEIANYWDMNGEQCPTEPVMRANLVIDESEKKAQIIITSQGVALYGIVELISDGDQKTRVVVHYTGNMNCPKQVSNFFKSHFQIL